MDFDSKNDESVFRYFVLTLVRKGCENNFYTHNQFANLVFGKADGSSMALINRIISRYRSYFEKQGNKKKLSIDRIEKDHPQIFDTKTAQIENNQGNNDSLINELINSLKQEKIAIKRTNHSIKIDGLKYINRISDKYVYSANLYWYNDEDLILNEGALLDLLPGGIQGAILSYNQLNNIIYFECSSRLNTSLNYFLKIDNARIIDTVIAVLKTYNTDGFSGLAKKIGNKKSYPTKFSQEILLESNQLDPSQTKAANSAINSDISFIWGPPGTGKSHCLSVILDKLHKMGERTLVVSIANIAVDQLLTRTLNLVDRENSSNSAQLINNGKIVRIGYITEEPLFKRFDKAPSSKQILSLYKSIRETQEKISKIKDEHKKAQLISQKRAFSRQIDEIQKKRIEGASLVFTTATKAIIDNKISGTDFDNLVIDEASMMSIPYLYALLKRISKRLIIAGDFAQLSPICISQTNLADKYLKKDLFSLAGISKNNTDHSSLSMLTINRRASKEICSLYNDVFYQGKIQVARNGSESKDGGIFYIPLKDVSAEMTESKSRRNTISFFVVIIFVNKLLTKTSSSIGIISPYRAQVNEYKRFFKESNLSKELTSRLKIGTIHTFQGSEADTIIFDTVDTSDIGVGRLFHHEQGERLINVAISRAKDTLIVVGDLEVFYKSNNVSAKVLRILNRIKSKKVSAQALTKCFQVTTKQLCKGPVRPW